MAGTPVSGSLLVAADISTTMLGHRLNGTTDESVSRRTGRLELSPLQQRGARPDATGEHHQFSDTLAAIASPKLLSLGYKSPGPIFAELIVQ